MRKLGSSPIGGEDFSILGGTSITNVVLYRTGSSPIGYEGLVQTWKGQGEAKLKISITIIVSVTHVYIYINIYHSI